MLSTRKKFNQWKNKKISSYGETDKDDRGMVIAMLEGEFDIKPCDNWFMLFHNNRVVDHIGYPPKLTRRSCSVFDIVHRPDISWKMNDEYYIVEIDGKIHNIKVSDTLKRNKHYDDADINYIVINKEDCKVEGKDWLIELRKELNKVLLK